jgi:hypothetical protein
MRVLEFGYHLMYRMGDMKANPIRPDEAPVNLIMVGISPGPLLAVAWDYPTKEWTFQPEAAIAILDINSDDHRTRPVDRETAEREALRFATKPLPSEAELTEICRAALAD